jgi:ATP-dependent helicase HepA
MEQSANTDQGLFDVMPPSSNSFIAPPRQKDHGADFHVGQIVAPRAEPTQTAAIVEVLAGEPENRYRLFREGVIKTYYASQLQPTQPESSSPEGILLSKFHAHLTAQQILHPNLSTLYSLNAAKVDFVEYQYRPVIKFIRSDRPRLLIADGVGVGKTIEAGLILRELQARRDIIRVLIICPKPLVVERKWEMEMKRFDECFTHLDGKDLRFCIGEMDLEGAWPDQHAKTIIPYSLFNESLVSGCERPGKPRILGLEELDPPPHFDLVIVDEAHRIRNTDTHAHAAVKFFCDHAEAVLFLTATPIELESDNLFVLLNVLRPDLVVDRNAYKHMAEPNQHINRAAELIRTRNDNWSTEAHEVLAEAAATPWGRSMLHDSPSYRQVRTLLDQDVISEEERVSLIKNVEQMHTFAGIINRTRRRDIGQFTLRDPKTVNTEFSEQEKELHDKILSIQASILNHLHGNKHIKFMMTTIRRQAASCLFGMVPLLEEILTRRLDDLAWHESDDTYDGVESTAIQEIEDEVNQILEQARNLPPKDRKLQALRKIALDKQCLPNNKIMVFSTFRHTLSYLYKRLTDEGLRVGLVHGGVANDERVTIRRRFQLDKSDSNALDMVLFSEVGCEGLDYQFCDCMVNFDLPWNPMKIEQRIGRIDRRGQKSEKVSIYNLITPGTVDADIYDRCLKRIGVFERELGAGEEILGEITCEIRNIAENMVLTPEQQCIKFQQLADNKIRLVQEQQDLEDKQRDFFGLRLPAAQDAKEIDSASSYWLKPNAIHNLVSQYLQNVCGAGHEYILGDKELKTLRMSQDLREKLRDDFRKLPFQKSVVRKQWDKWLKGNDQHLSITFSTVCAVDNPDATLLTPFHPLVRQAAKACHAADYPITACQIVDDSIPPGEYPFSLYQWQLHGVFDDVVLRTVSTSKVISEQLMSYLERAEGVDRASITVPTTEVFEDLEQRHYGMLKEAIHEHRTHVRQMVDYKLESLTTSHTARLASLEEQLAQATNEKIRKMRLGQIRVADADYARRKAEMERAAEQAGITFHQIAGGVLAVVPTPSEKDI